MNDIDMNDTDMNDTDMNDTDSHDTDNHGTDPADVARESFADDVVTGEVVPDGGADPFGVGIAPADPGSGLDLGAMLQMAQDMGQRMQEAQEELATTEVLGTAGGGIVEVRLNGHLHLVGIRIDPSAMDPDDPTMLEDLIVAAWSDARDGVARLQAQADPLGGLGDLGGLGGLLGGA